MTPDRSPDTSSEGYAPVPVDQYSLCIIKVPCGVGTGFAFLRPEWVVTAKHVVVESGGPASPIELLYTPDVKLAARLAFNHPAVDLAVLEVLGTTRCRAPLMPCDRPLADGSFLCVGHRPSVSHPASGRYTAFVSGIPEVQKSRIPLPDGREEVVLTFAAPNGEPGHSGGPVLGEGGGVVAAVVEGITLAGQHHMRATSILPLLDYLTFKGMQA